VALCLAALTTLSFGQAHVGHAVPTTPVPLPGRPVPATGTFILTESGLSARTLGNKLGKGARVRDIAAGVEVSGVSAGQLAVAAHALAQTAMHLTEKGKQARPASLDAGELARLNALNDALVRYGLMHDFAGSLPAGTGPTITRSIYPAPQCFEMTCSDCGASPSAEACAALEGDKDAAYDSYARAATIEEVWQATSRAMKSMRFYGAVAGTLGDLVSAASTTLLVGSPSAADQATATLLIQMARDGVLEALLRQLGIASLSETAPAQVEQRLQAAEAARVSAADALKLARGKWVDCTNRSGARAPSEQSAFKSAVLRYDGCRYRVYLGQTPECKLEPAACPK
jgi:hypothetical protein